VHQNGLRERGKINMKLTKIMEQERSRGTRLDETDNGMDNGAPQRQYVNIVSSVG
jgi:hypothetical protein